MTVEKDEPPPVVDCGTCTGGSPKSGNPTCASCIARQFKMSAGKAAISVEA